MTKDEVASQLKENGYDAINSGGVISVRLSAEGDKDIAVQRKKLVSILDKLSYTASWGYKALCESSFIAEDETGEMMEAGDVRAITTAEDGQLSFI